MFDIIANLILLTLMLIGVVSLIQWAVFCLYTPSKKGKMIILIPIEEQEQDDIEFLIRSANARARKLGARHIADVVVLDYGMSAEAREICLRTFADLRHFHMCDAKGLDDHIRGVLFEHI